jgi:DNA-binding FadR family transcriptional regulator
MIRDAANPMPAGLVVFDVLLHAGGRNMRALPLSEPVARMRHAERRERARLWRLLTYPGPSVSSPDSGQAGAGILTRSVEQLNWSTTSPRLRTMLQIQPIRRDSVISKAAEEIARYLEIQALEPGERLPSEVVLAQMLGISRNSLREALRVLIGLGFIEKRADKGLVVKRPLLAGIQVNNELRNPDESVIAAAAPVAFQVRAVIESRCAELASQVASEGDLEDIGKHLTSFRDALDAKDFVKASQHHLAFHDGIVTAAHNPVLASIYYQVRFVTSEIGQMGAPKLYRSRELLPVHEQMFDALKQRRNDRILSTVAAHFKSVGRLTEFIADNKAPAVARVERSSRKSNKMP